MSSVGRFGNSELRLQSFSQLTRLKAEGTRHTFERNAAVGIDKVETVWPTRIVLLNLVLHGIEQGGHGNVKFAHAGRSNPLAISGVGGILEDDAFLDVALRLPEIARVRFINVNNKESDMLAILLVKLVERGNLPAKGRSGIAAKDEHDGLHAAKRREGDSAGVVQQRESEIGRRIADS